MRFFVTATALAAWLLPLSTAAAMATAGKEESPHLQPPQVFRNLNVVQATSLEKSYVRETFAIQFENTSPTVQTDYYVAVPSSHFSRIGGFEAREGSSGPYLSCTALPPSRASLLHSSDGSSRGKFSYYRVRLTGAGLKPHEKRSLSVAYNIIGTLRPQPTSIDQEGAQYLVYEFGVVPPSAYPASRSRAELRASGAFDMTTCSRINASIPSVPSSSSSSQGGANRVLVYGPFEDTAAETRIEHGRVRFEFTRPVLVAPTAERDVYVSHWGGNVAFEERIDLRNLGANLTRPFNRVRWSQTHFMNPPSVALKELRMPLSPGSVDPYYTDVIGNVSTSRFRQGSLKAAPMLELRPRYPVFGGWRYPYTVGWNADAKNFVRHVADSSTGGFVLNVPFFEGPRQAEGIAYEKVRVRVLLPEGSTNVKWHTTMPATSITNHSISLVHSFLDTLGRTVLTIDAENIVDDLRDRTLVVTYDYPLTASFRKPFVIFASSMLVFVAAYFIGGVQVRIEPTKGKK